MFNRRWVISGIIIFAAAAAFPFYWHAVGPHAPFPELELPTKEKKCIESVEYMRTNHMRLLDVWRNAVVRDNLFIYTASDGKQYEMNLHRTCMGCHKSRERFCKRCHDYNDVAPPCWDCHFAPSEVRKTRSAGTGTGTGKSNVHPVARKGEPS